MTNISFNWRHREIKHSYYIEANTQIYNKWERFDGVVISVAGHEISDNWLVWLRILLAFVGKDYHPLLHTFNDCCPDIT